MSDPALATTAPDTSLRRRRARSSVLAQGTSAIWLTGSAVTIALVMIVGLLALVIYLGGRTFWPRTLVQVTTLDDVTHLGEVIDAQEFRPSGADLRRFEEQLSAQLRRGARLSEIKDEGRRKEVEALIASEVANRMAIARDSIDEKGGVVRRRKFYIGNRKQDELNQETYLWVPDYAIKPESESRPEWAVLFERQEWRNFYGFPAKFLARPEVEAGQPDAPFEVLADDPASVWQAFEEHHPRIRELFEERVALEKDAGDAARIADLNRTMDRYRIVMRMSDGREVPLRLEDIVRGYPANRLDGGDKLGVYLSRWGEFLTDRPREANNEGGVMPAIFGTVAMTLTMSLLVVPFGVLAALYLREYAKSGRIVSTVRIAINNLAGVPSIVFGIFGLGFFCYLIGGTIDDWFFPDKPTPTFGTGGLLWASLTLALLTLPVVIVSTEEALAAVPNSMREGSYACGASKWQTIWRIVLPRAMPGIMTGMILAMARGADEVAPLMLVGAMNSAPELPIDGEFPFLHPERSFMHLGFHIYEVGFQSQDSEAARPMVFTTTLLLIAIIAILNLTAIWLRSRLRRRFRGSQL